MIKEYIISKDNFDSILSYLTEIEQKANELAKKYEKENNDDFERFFDTIASAGMKWEDIEAESKKIYYDSEILISDNLGSGFMESIMTIQELRDDITDRAGYEDWFDDDEECIDFQKWIYKLNVRDLINYAEETFNLTITIIDKDKVLIHYND